MAEIAKMTLSGEFGQYLNSTMSPGRREDCSQNNFVVIDIESLTGVDKNLTPTPSTRLKMQKKLSRKGSQGGAAGGENITYFVTGGPDACEKSSLPVHVEDGQESPVMVPTATPTAAAGGGGSRWMKRAAKRPPSAWQDPRRVMLFFATMSIMGTLILLYFTLSMDKMAAGGGDANDR